MLKCSQNLSPDVAHCNLEHTINSYKLFSVDYCACLTIYGSSLETPKNCALYKP